MTTQMWAVFGVAVAVGLVADFMVFRKATRVTLRRALIESAAWIGLALAFNLWIYISRGHQSGLEFLTSYLVEKSLSVDNIFLFVLIFQALHVPAEAQHRVLYSGVLGALVFRAAFVFAGIAVLGHFHSVLFVFGGVLLFTGVRMLLPAERKVYPERGWAVRLVRRVFRVTEEYHGLRFWVRRDGKWSATPLFVALVAIEAMDLIFAVDSVPAVLAITRDSFIAYSSIAFAILGLRAMYFALAEMLPRFRFLHPSLAAVLIFVGLKMLAAEKIPISAGVSLVVIVGIMATGIAASLCWPAKPLPASIDV